MAFISGYNTEYRCKLCGEIVTRTLNKNGGIGMLGYSLTHEAEGCIMVNGYPSACPRNKQGLEQGMVNKIDVPIIHSARSGFY
jgi:hypothetical protein